MAVDGGQARTCKPVGLHLGKKAYVPFDGDSWVGSLIGDSSDGSLLGRICLASVGLLSVSGAAVSVMMSDGGHRGVAFATDDIARRLEDVQFTLGQGPAIEAFGTGATVVAHNLAEQSVRWPAFAVDAERLGARAVIAFPLSLGAATLGTFGLYHDHPGGLDRSQMARAVRLSRAAALALLDTLGALTTDPAGTSSNAGGGPGLFRAEVHQAAGMLSVQLKVPIETALVRLRAYAYSTGRSTADVARDIVGRKLRMETDNE